MVKSFRYTWGSNGGPSDYEPSTLPLDQIANSDMQTKFRRLAFFTTVSFYVQTIQNDGIFCKNGSKQVYFLAWIEFSNLYIVSMQINLIKTIPIMKIRWKSIKIAKMIKTCYCHCFVYDRRPIKMMLRKSKQYMYCPS